MEWNDPWWFFYFFEAKVNKTTTNVYTCLFQKYFGIQVEEECRWDITISACIKCLLIFVAAIGLLPSFESGHSLTALTSHEWGILIAQPSP